MDLNEVIRSLYEEKRKLDRLIATLETVSADGEPAVAKSAKPRRRRRRQLTAERRQEISERMKKYWAARRGESDGAQPASEPAKTAPDTASLAPQV